MKRLLILLLMTTPASAHSFYVAEKQEVNPYADCCTGTDCHPIPYKMAQELDNGSYHVTIPVVYAKIINPASHVWTTVEETVPFKEVKASPDGQYHACLYETQSLGPTHRWLRCFFAPPKGT